MLQVANAGPSHKAVMSSEGEQPPAVAQGCQPQLEERLASKNSSKALQSACHLSVMFGHGLYASNFVTEHHRAVKDKAELSISKAAQNAAACLLCCLA